MATRRDFIKILGGGTIVAAGVAVGLTAFPPGLPDATAAWNMPGANESDIRRKALSYAILAPNPHNLQPWLADLSEPDTIVMYLDPERLLPATDPFSRQIVLGCGAFLELLYLAANAFGAEVAITPWPDGAPGARPDDRPFASIHFSPSSKTRRPLFEQILKRRTNRELYDVARIPKKADLDAITAVAKTKSGLTATYTVDPAKVAALREIVWQGWVREMNTPATMKESVDVMRIGSREVARYRDGIALDGPVINLMKAAGLISRSALLDPHSTINKEGATIWKRMADTAPAFLWLQGPDNERLTQIEAGRAYARINLEATARGLSIHPWSMGLEEYAEMSDIYARQQAMLAGSANAPIQMLVRIGYAPAVPPAPRRGIDTLIKV